MILEQQNFFQKNEPFGLLNRLIGAGVNKTLRLPECLTLLFERMRKVKKVISIVLSLIMALSVFSAASFNAMALESTGICGTNAKYSLNSKTGTLTISGKGKIFDQKWYEDDDEWFVESPFSNNSKIKKVVIKDGITGFGIGYTFNNCSNLKSVSFPKSFTENYSIHPNQFEKCYKLEKITVDPENKVIDSRDNCNAVIYKKLDEMILACSKTTIPNTVKAIDEGVFTDIKNLKEIYIPASVNRLWFTVFANCPNVEKIVVAKKNETYSSGDNCNAIMSKDGRYLIFGCKNTVMPDTVEAMAEEAFQYCKGLKSIHFGSRYGYEDEDPEDDVYEEPIAARYFRGCPLLESITVDENNERYYSPKGSNVLIRRKNNALILGCKNTVIPDTVTSIENGAFSGDITCRDLTEMSIPDSVTAMDGNVFADCKKLKTVKLSNNLPYVQMGTFENCTALENVTLPENIKIIASSAFYNCSALKSIELPESLEKIWFTAFGKCSSLKSIHIPKNVSEIKISAFTNCPSLESITVDDENNTFDSRDNCNAIITTKNNALRVGCKNTEIPETVVKIGQDAFFGCTGLKNIDIPNAVTEIGGSAFALCKNLASVKLPKSTNKIDSSAFYKCSSLKSVTIPESVSSIQPSAFRNCKNLKTIKVSSKNKTYDSRNKCNAVVETKTNKLILGCAGTVIPKTAETIGSGAFSDCFALKRINIPSGVKKIERFAFSNCKNLAAISFKKSIKTIQEGAFARCKKLRSIYYSGTLSNWKKIKIDYTGEDETGTWNSNVALKRAVRFYSSSTLRAKVSSESKGFKVSWNKLSAAKGYQIQYSTSSDFKNAKKITVKGNKTFSKTIKGLKANKKYFVRVRSYKLKNSVRQYGAWSAYKTVTTK